MNWIIPKIWNGGDVWILGGGPSVPKQFGIPEAVIKSVTDGTSTPNVYSQYMQKLHKKHVIGINKAYTIGEWMDIIFFGDDSFFLKNQKGLAEYSGMKVSCHPIVQRVDYVKFVQRDPEKTRGISKDPGKVSWNYNSGGAAISLAAQAGAKRIFLLGFDMQLQNGNMHWHNLYNRKIDPKNNKTPLPFDKHLAGFKYIAKDAKAMGIEIINICPESAIQEFPKVNLSDVL